MRWEVVEDVMVTFATPGEIDNQALTAWTKDIKTKPVTKLLGANVGAVEANSAQRKLAVDTVKGKNVPVAIVSDQALTRGIVTAASWLGANIRAFSWSELREATEFLQIRASLQGRVIDTLMRLRNAA
ncbi:MAG TPA: hypothetical protein VH877_00090 [Polyangia bacterium]|jgi:hypothetical protein|nr:hypothetical protein [Polyangia bacterium]